MISPSAAVMSAREPVSPPPCARSGLPPPFPPNRCTIALSAADASRLTSGARAMTISAGSPADRNAATTPGRLADADARAFSPP